MLQIKSNKWRNYREEHVGNDDFDPQVSYRIIEYIIMCPQEIHAILGFLYCCFGFSMIKSVHLFINNYRNTVCNEHPAYVYRNSFIVIIMYTYILQYCKLVSIQP